jgi:hypothetical protein
VRVPGAGGAAQRHAGGFGHGPPSATNGWQVQL